MSKIDIKLMPEDIVEFENKSKKKLKKIKFKIRDNPFGFTSIDIEYEFK